MAHRSRRKHLEHVHQHEPATPPAKSPRAKAPAAGTPKKRKNQQRVADVRSGAKVVRAKATGLVRRIARTATRKLAAKRRSIISRARARVGSLIEPRGSK